MKSDDIADFRAVAARQDSVEPRNVYVSARVQPAFGLQWMDITFTFVLSFAA
jgi:hypothetical protein